jgi:hypothetical protein
MTFSAGNVLFDADISFATCNRQPASEIPPIHAAESLFEFGFQNKYLGTF